MGRDETLIRWFCPPGDFNPLSPHGERQVEGYMAISNNKFQSTLPAWGETAQIAELEKELEISIHSPRMGRDTGWQSLSGPAGHFNPLSPHGERP